MMRAAQIGVALALGAAPPGRPIVYEIRRSGAWTRVTREEWLAAPDGEDRRITASPASPE